MLDRLTSMQVFVQVAASGSFSAAARGLGLSQTMVTKHVAALEERLGVRLLLRSTRRLSLTDPGRRFLESCRQILPEIEEIEHSVSAERHRPSGKLRLSVPVSFAIRYVAPLMPDFSRRYLDVTVELGLDDRKVNLVEEGWDMALRVGRLDDATTLRARHLADIRLVPCAAPSYLARMGTPRRVEDLERHVCLGYTLDDRLGPWRWAFGREKERVVPVSGPLCANNGDVLREAAIAGMGIVLQPLFLLADEIRAGRLTLIELDEPPSRRLQLHAVYVAGHRAPLKVRAMIDYLVEQFGAVPPWEEGQMHGMAKGG